MIKLTNVEITNNFDTKEEKIFLSKSEIGRMSRDKSENFTNITMKNNDFPSYSVKETPEEILAMPDTETRVIDWEQRRYEIAKDVMAAIYTRPNVNGTLLNISLIVNAADALIDVLKKGQDNEN